MTPQFVDKGKILHKNKWESTTIQQKIMPGNIIVPKRNSAFTEIIKEDTIIKMNLDKGEIYNKNLFIQNAMKDCKE